MQELTRLDPMSVAKMYAAVSLALGLVIGVPWALFAGAMGFGLGAGSAEVGIMMLMAIGFPIAYAIAGFIGGALLAGVYNLLAGWIGGIEIELTSTQTQHQGSTPSAGPTPTDR